MPDDLDWLYRPVIAGCIRYESLVDGALTLDDVAEINDALTIHRMNHEH